MNVKFYSFFFMLFAICVLLCFPIKTYASEIDTQDIITESDVSDDESTHGEKMDISDDESTHGEEVDISETESDEIETDTQDIESETEIVETESVSDNDISLYSESPIVQEVYFEYDEIFFKNISYIIIFMLGVIILCLLFKR